MKPTLILTGVLGIVLSCLAPAYAQSASEYPPAPWPPELGGAFERYYAGDFLFVQQYCQQLAAARRDDRLRREATALGAMATMRLPGRDNQRDGKTQLMRLGEEDPRLLTRPDCRFALGVAETGFFATAEALSQFNAAAKSFAKRGRTARLAETYVEMARTWSLHAEWEFAIPGIDIRRPDNADQANQLRVRQIRDLRARAVELPDSADAVDQIDVILAEQLLRTEGGEEEGLRALTQLAKRSPLTETAGRAALVLAQRGEKENRWDEAIALYERIEAAGIGGPSTEAAKHLEEIRAPKLELEVPEQIAPGESAGVHIQTRNVHKIEFEVRRVDLSGWLEQRHGQFLESALPVTGATITARDLKIETKNTYDLWDSDGEAESLDFSAPAGSLVVVARATDARGGILTVKRLLIVSSLQLHAIVGPRHVALWARLQDAAESTPAPASLEALFWMHGSFVPQRWRLEGGAGVFPLPPDSRLLRDKRWVAVLRTGEELAVCHGVLSDSTKTGGTAAVVLSGGPSLVRVGEEIHVAGRIVGVDPRTLTEHTVEISCQDSSDKTVLSTSLELQPEATFAAHFPVDVSLVDKVLRIRVRYAGRTLTDVYSQLYVRVAPLDEPEYAARFEIEPWWPTARREISAQITAHYPWGTPIGDARASLTIQPTIMPVTSTGAPGFHPLCRLDDERTDYAGRIFINQDTTTYELPEGPIALGFWTTCMGKDGREAAASVETIIADEPVHVWIETEGEPVALNRDVRFQVHWFDPGGLTAGRVPTLSVRRAGEEWEDLPVVPCLLYVRGPIWRAPVPGNYEIRAALAANDGRVFTVTRKIEVADAADITSADGMVRFAAQWGEREERRGIDVRLKGGTGPLLLLLHDGDPVAARIVADVSGVENVFMPVEAETRSELELLVLRPSSSQGLTSMGECVVLPDSGDALSIHPSFEGDEITLGGPLAGEVECRRGEELLSRGVLVERLIDLTHCGGMQWIPGAGRPDVYWLPDGLRYFSAETRADSSPDAEVIPETRELPAQQLSAWFTGRTLWCGASPIESGRASSSLWLPREPGYYRLLLCAYGSGGEFAVKSLDFDLRSGIFFDAWLPERLYLGDRIDVAVRIENATTTPRQFTFHHDGKAALHHEAWSIRSAVPGEPAPAWDENMPVKLGAGETVILNARVEAARIGPCENAPVYAIESEDYKDRVLPRCTILATEPTGSDANPPTLNVERKLFRLHRDYSIEVDDPAMAGMRSEQALQWMREEISPGDRLHPGELVLVQEYCTSRKSLDNLSWRQDLPANCSTHQGEWEDFPRLGVRDELRLQSVRYTARRVDADRRILHEYVMVPVRSGVCWFPAPHAIAGENVVGVKLDTQYQRIVVVEEE